MLGISKCLVSSEEFYFSISQNSAEPDIRALALAAGWDGRARVNCYLTAQYIRGIYLPNGTSFPGGLQITVSNNTLLGGLPGSHALTTYIPLTIDNRGAIYGGGGYGGTGGGGVGWTPDVGYECYGDGGGGGQGQGLSWNGAVMSVTGPYAGGAGSADVKYDYSTGVTNYCYGGQGGTGGVWGQYGNSGSYAYGGGNAYADRYYPTGGTAPGAYVYGINRVTWINTGDCRGLTYPT